LEVERCTGFLVKVGRLKGSEWSMLDRRETALRQFRFLNKGAARYYRGALCPPALMGPEREMKENLIAEKFHLRKKSEAQHIAQFKQTLNSL
jgi:hypothetical protein